MNQEKKREKFPKKFDIRRVNINHQSGWNFLKKDTSDNFQAYPLSLSDIWIKPTGNRSLAELVLPGQRQNAVIVEGNCLSWQPEFNITGKICDGTPDNGDFVPAGSVGQGYNSPGYEQ
ncbi:MAG: hypothetical protein HC908_09720 [Calothrix sp. SM1_7_51]|nr:hypothetical protein [Calothrix sp. SM1_7_51]